MKKQLKIIEVVSGTVELASFEMHDVETTEIIIPGPAGPRGYDFEYEWDGQKLGVKHSDEEEFTYVDLGLHFEWDGTNLGIKTAEDEEFTYTDLEGSEGPQGETGPQGDTGPKGDKPDHEWDDTSLRFQNPDGSWGDYVDLKGPKGEKGDPGGEFTESDMEQLAQMQAIIFG